ncbi:YgjV family protein [Mannheimia varigena]|uniref:L-lactate dehydrogenase n=1 Tax=Mannheimia varigena USDA-ARS-USMARC-1296 TaxID=1433287 RepID=W0QDM3_9PAST|nr:YgjV family protein [Mannheimia varigena]AHG75323.1 L-lactate dehydrogenase [Mannheimia varigena USDA-ARS-USMARC-1296]MDY2946950.1 YgjV family protein [Mannheimia varigena]QLD33272.1 YgjV family protein [Mannheimia varigena]
MGNYVEILGYVAMVLVASSFLLKDVIKLRVVNSIGCACFVAYGLMIGSIPVTGLNALVVCINLYYIFKGNKPEMAQA